MQKQAGDANVIANKYIIKISGLSWIGKNSVSQFVSLVKAIPVGNQDPEEERVIFGTRNKAKQRHCGTRRGCAKSS